MSLDKGFRLGPYEILDPIGAGGMGEVYSAQDTRLDRVVAIKVLPSHLMGQGHIIERFDREAKAISSLQHPHICALYDVGHAQGIHYLVMEFLEGETLATRLLSGRLETSTALAYGQEIAEALDAAHRNGIVHRDLKPGNIMITKEGIKLLDFGLAKVGEPASHPASGTIPGLSGMATKTLPNTPLTQEGTILGTFQYMSPEQLEGKDADSRTDIFALGAILYEMVTGQRAFHGDSQASLIASIMSSIPRPTSEFEALTPPALDSVIRTCIAKSAEDRWQTAHDVALQLKWIGEVGSEVGVPRVVSTKRKTRERMAWVIAAVASLAVLVFGVSMFMNRTPIDKYTMRFRIPVTSGIQSNASPRISPDGRCVAYLASDSTGMRHIWIHRLNSLEPQSLHGTETANRPFWSPDSRFLAFFTSAGKLKKIAIGGGPPITIGESPGGADGTWGSQGIILFDQSANDSVQSIPASGGVPSPATVIDRSRGETGTVWPYFLPDGERFLFLAAGQRREDMVLKGGRLGSLETKVIGQVGTRFEYVEPGCLLFVRGGTLVSQEFDAKSMELRGEPVPVAENVSSGGVNFEGSFSASLNGVLTFWTSPPGGKNRLLWVDRKGEVLGEIGDAAAYNGFDLSPDEEKLVVSITDPVGETSDIWIRDLARDTMSRFTFDPEEDRTPVWSPDGTQIIFSSDRKGEGDSDLYIKDAGGIGEPELVLETERVPDFIHDWSRDGKWLLVGSFESGSRLNLKAMPASGTGDVEDVAVSSFHEHVGKFSPDGRWLAYASNESGTFEVYVQAFPKSEGKWQISVRGGSSPRWNADGTELFYLSPSRKLTGVPVDGSGTGFKAGLPVELFDAPVSSSEFNWSRYQPSKDGTRFLLLSPSRSLKPPPITVVLNWQEELGAY